MNEPAHRVQHSAVWPNPLVSGWKSTGFHGFGMEYNLISWFRHGKSAHFMVSARNITGFHGLGTMSSWYSLVANHSFIYSTAAAWPTFIFFIFFIFFIQRVTG